LLGGGPAARQEVSRASETDKARGGPRAYNIHRDEEESVMDLVNADSLLIWEDRHLLHSLEKKLSPRKHRLFVAGCCRLAWHLAPEGPCHQAVKTAEMYADGRVDAKALIRARRAAGAVRQALEEEWCAATVVHGVSRTPETGAACHRAHARY